MNRHPRNRTTHPAVPTTEEIREWFADPAWARKYPPLLSVEQAAELAQVPIATIYDWRSRGHLEWCSCRAGKRVRILRDRFVTFLFSSNS